MWKVLLDSGRVPFPSKLRHLVVEWQCILQRNSLHSFSIMQNIQAWFPPDSDRYQFIFSSVLISQDLNESL